MTNERGRQVIIVGGGTAGWMTAAALARFLPPGWRVRLIESDAIGTVGVGEATIPQIRLFNAGLGIDEDDFLRATQGTIKLGVEFVDWMGAGSRYIHAFGPTGGGWGLLPFHHYWLRDRLAGGTSSLWDYNAAALAARENRFERVLGAPQAPTGLAWAFQFDAGLYALYLRRYAEGRGVERIEGEVVDAARDGETGDVAAVTLKDGQRVAGDLFVDCSGFRGLLIEQALHAGYDDWRDLLPCDRALAVPSENVRPLTPYTRATARAAGWQWRIPLQHRCGNGLVYCSRFLSDDEAAATLLAHLDGPALAEPRPLRFVSGKRRRAWVGNCVAVGLSAGFMEPLESTSIHLIQSAIARLLLLLPPAGPAREAAAEFNRQTEREWLDVRDFLVFHYHANGRDEPFWRERRDAAIPDTLRDRVALFRATGNIFPEAGALFTEAGWLQVMVGQGIEPAAYNPIADALPADELPRFLQHHAGQAQRIVAAMPSHDRFLAQRCAAPAKVAA